MLAGGPEGLPTSYPLVACSQWPLIPLPSLVLQSQVAVGGAEALVPGPCPGAPHCFHSCLLPAQP